MAETPPPPWVPLWSPPKAGRKSLNLNPLGAKGAEEKFWLLGSNIGRGGGGGPGGGPRLLLRCTAVLIHLWVYPPPKKSLTDTQAPENCGSDVRTSDKGILGLCAVAQGWGHSILPLLARACCLLAQKKAPSMHVGFAVVDLHQEHLVRPVSNQNKTKAQSIDLVMMS